MGPKHNYKVGQLCVIAKRQETLKGGAVNSLRTGATIKHRGVCITKKSALLQSEAGITNWGKRYYKVEQVIYYKVERFLLESGVDIIRWGNYYRKDQYILVIPG